MTMPERVWHCWVGHNGIGWVECASDHPHAVPFVPEQRALDAERELALVREGMHNVAAQCTADLAACRAEAIEHEQNRATAHLWEGEAVQLIAAHRAQVAALTADKEALVPLLDELEAHHVDQNERKGRDESRSTTLRLVRAARAVLGRVP